MRAYTRFLVIGAAGALLIAAQNAPRDSRPAGLDERGASVAAAVSTDPAAFPFTAKLTVGDKRACTGALVDASWVLTAASCFTDSGATPAAGAPTDPTSVVVGRTDLATTAGQTRTVVELVPRTDRDLVMAHLSAPVFDVAPVALSGTAVAGSETLQAIGYGRTRTEWAPNKPHLASFTADAPSASAFTLAAASPANATVCKGDAGGPVWRTENGNPALVGAVSRAWQGGCLGTPATETRTGASATRTDDLAAWTASTVAAGGTALKPGTKLMSGQSVTGPDLKLTMRADGNLVVTHKQVDGGVLWSSGTSGNNGAWAYVQPDGNFVLYKSDADPAGGTGALWGSNTWGQDGAFLSLGTNGDVAMVKADGSAAVWSAGTARLDAKLNSDTKIKSGQWVQSQGAVVEMQQDGNLVRYRRSDATPTWTTNTDGNNGAWAYLQSDGNFVVYKSDGNPAGGTGALWGSNTWGRDGAFLKLQDDGGFVMYKKDAAETVANSIWSVTTLRPVSRLAPGQQLYAKTTRLAMQWDGDLVLYRLSDNTVLWHSNTAGNGNAYLKVQDDGNVVVSSSDGSRALWSSGTFWSAGAYLKLQDDGNLVIYKADGGEGIGNAVWASGTSA
ncbi:trypsin-like serine protease [Kitasatospora griseola]|uniref:trypsin-like serine protease n=1 Tax=Kitasatospora griseola TaxID=2064 RepID=UPI00381CD5C6